jgi:beta-galactosidase GanA
VIAPSLQLLAGGEADLLKLYVQNGGTLVGTFNTGLVDEHHIAPDSGYPHDLTDLFGMEVLEFDPLPPGEENHLTFKGAFPTSHLHPARIWCDLIEPKECQILATYAKDFYAGRPAMTMNSFGLGKAVYLGTMSHQHFYYDLVVWLRQICNLVPLLKVPDTVEVSMREKGDTRIYFLLNHQNTPVRIQFYKPAHDFLTERPSRATTTSHRTVSWCCTSRGRNSRFGIFVAQRIQGIHAGGTHGGVKPECDANGGGDVAMLCSFIDRWREDSPLNNRDLSGTVRGRR